MLRLIMLTIITMVVVSNEKNTKIETRFEAHDSNNSKGKALKKLVIIDSGRVY